MTKKLTRQKVTVIHPAFVVALRQYIPIQKRAAKVMGTIHGTEIFASACPDVSYETAASIAHFLDSVSG